MQPTVPPPVHVVELSPATPPTLSSQSSSHSKNYSWAPSADDLSLQPALPPKRARAKRFFSLPAASPHRRLILCVAVLNLALLAVAVAHRWWANLPALAYPLLANLTAAVLIRQQRLINFLFRLATAPRTRLPLPVRWALGKIYHFGGLHSGCAVAATVWLLLFTVAATVLYAAAHPQSPSTALLALTYAILFLLLVIVAGALPTLRARFHNSFEATHRFLGWSSLALFWAHAVLLIRDFKPEQHSLARAFFTSPAPYLLFLVTLSVVSPWMTLRKVPVSVQKPSNHAIIVSFRENIATAFPGSYSAISVDPLFEWHSFANIPTPGQPGFRLIISRAGDWTGRIVDNPPTHFWVRGIPTAGVATIETLFSKVLYVCTGSGIGPVLPHLLARQDPSRLFWSTRTPRDTYGDALMQEIMDASPDAVIHDTTLYGKPDIVATAYAMVKEFAAEAVIVISNQKLTRKVVYGVESRGIPAFGAIWDS